MKMWKQMMSVVAGLLIALSVSGCLEIKTNTQVKRDGSLVRMQKLTGDSTEVLGHRFPSIIDSTWTVSVKYIKEPEADKGWERVAVKTFKDADELNASMASVPGLSVRFRATLEKRFRWFFTEYMYKEAYLCYNPFNSIPLSQYVSQTEFDRAFRHAMNKESNASDADSLAENDMDARFKEWRSRNIFEAYYSELRKGVVALVDRELTPVVLDSHKDELFGRTKDLFEGGGKADTILTIAQRVLKSPKIRRAVQMNEEGFASYREKLDFADEVAHSYQTSITMPGLIIDTNAPTVEGTTATWKSMDMLAYVVGFDVWVKSRIVNWWAVVVGGLLVLAAVVLSGLAVARKRRAV